MNRITIKHTIKGGNLIKKENIDRIFALGKAGEYSGKVFTSKVDVKTYVPRYKLVKEPKGYIFREVVMGSGIAGHTKTIREQVIVASRFYSIFVD